MLESLAAISLIGNIIQFVCFGLDILSRSQEIYHSTTGSLSGNANKETLTEHLIALSTSLQDRSPNSPSADPELGKLCQACKDVSRELLAALNKLKLADATGSPWKSVRKAFRTVWTKDKIESIEQRLKGLREELNLHINAKLRQRVDLLSLQQSSRFDTLDEMSKAVINAILNQEDVFKLELRSGLRAQTEELAVMHIQTKHTVKTEHHTTRQLIHGYLEGTEQRLKATEHKLEANEHRISQLEKGQSLGLLAELVRNYMDNKLRSKDQRMISSKHVPSEPAPRKRKPKNPHDKAVASQLSASPPKKQRMEDEFPRKTPFAELTNQSPNRPHLDIHLTGASKSSLRRQIAAAEAAIEHWTSSEPEPADNDSGIDADPSDYDDPGTRKKYIYDDPGTRKKYIVVPSPPRRESRPKRSALANHPSPIRRRIPRLAKFQRERMGVGRVLRSVSSAENSGSDADCE